MTENIDIGIRHQKQAKQVTGYSSERKATQWVSFVNNIQAISHTAHKPQDNDNDW